MSYTDLTPSYLLYGRGGCNFEETPRWSFRPTWARWDGWSG